MRERLDAKSSADVAAETKRQYHVRYLEAYYEKIGDMSKKEIAAYKAELLQWDEDYEKQCGHEMEEAGDAWKGVAEAQKGMSALVSASYSVASCVKGTARRSILECCLSPLRKRRAPCYGPRSPLHLSSPR